MNILAGADFHGDHEVNERFVGVGASRSIDAVVLAGDLSGCPDGYASIEEAQRADAEFPTKQLDRLGVPNAPCWSLNRRHSAFSTPASWAAASGAPRSGI